MADQVHKSGSTDQESDSTEWLDITDESEENNDILSDAVRFRIRTKPFENGEDQHEASSIQSSAEDMADQLDLISTSDLKELYEEIRSNLTDEAENTRELNTKKTHFWWKLALMMCILLLVFSVYFLSQSKNLKTSDTLDIEINATCQKLNSTKIQELGKVQNKSRVVEKELKDWSLTLKENLTAQIRQVEKILDREVNASKKTFSDIKEELSKANEQGDRDLLLTILQKVQRNFNNGVYNLSNAFPVLIKEHCLPELSFPISNHDEPTGNRQTKEEISLNDYNSVNMKLNVYKRREMKKVEAKRKEIKEQLKQEKENVDEHHEELIARLRVETDNFKKETRWRFREMKKKLTVDEKDEGEGLTSDGQLLILQDELTKIQNALEKGELNFSDEFRPSLYRRECLPMLEFNSEDRNYNYESVMKVFMFLVAALTGLLVPWLIIAKVWNT